MKPGLFIVVEGLDGTGKTTFAQALAHALGAAYLKTPPEEISRFRADLDDVLGRDPMARQLFYASGVAAASARVRELRARGRHVVVDRYWASTCVYASLGSIPVDLHDLDYRLERPDYTFFLDLPEKERRRRIRARGATMADLFSIRDQRALRDAYETELSCSGCGEVVVLDTAALHPDGCVRAALQALGRKAA